MSRPIMHWFYNIETTTQKYSSFILKHVCIYEMHILYGIYTIDLKTNGLYPQNIDL